ncbi:MAG: heavy metal translocating P-type ATPase [Clostridia bacterium]|nr:heavy metal translocating P-type ATPase [Clostridia bacterium]
MKLTRSQKKRLWSIIAGAVLFAAGAVLGLLDFELFSAIAFAAAGAAAGWLCIVKAFTGIARGDFFDENMLMTIAASGAVILGEYPECAAVMILYQIGELFQSIAVGRSRRSIRELTALCPDFAHALRNGEVKDIPTAELAVGDIVQIRAGERIPADCTVIKGETTVDTSPVTGESVPRDAAVGDRLYSGCINVTGLVNAQVDRVPADSAAGRILKLTETASDRKTKSEAFITRFAKVYTPAVALFAALIALGVPLILLLANGTPYSESLPEWSRRALSMLVISCPCALVISVPLGYFCGLGNASRNGILIKGSTCVDTLAGVDTAVFDKTGTLTGGILSVTDIVTDSDKDELLRLAASAEKNSSHPIAKAICKAADSTYGVESVTEITGSGVEACLSDGRIIKVCRPEIRDGTTAVEVFENGKLIGRICLADTIKPTTAQALEKMRSFGVKKTVMLTGDNKASAEEVAEKAGIDETEAELLPEQKYSRIEELCRDGTVMYVGDGINDSPSLAGAHVGVAMGALGAQAAIEAADVVLMSGDLDRLAYALKLAKRTVKAVKANIIISLLIKASVLILASLDIVGMWAAVAADVGVCIVCVTNSMRLLK